MIIAGCGHRRRRHGRRIASAGRPTAPPEIVRCLGEPEVQHLHRAVRPDLDVRRLQVAMDDALLVRGLERVGDLPGDGQRLVERDRPRARSARRQVSPSTSSMHEGAHVPACSSARAVDRARCSDGSATPASAPRASNRASALRVGGERLRQDLDGDVAIELRVARAIHLAHAAFAQLGEDLIRAERDSGSEAQRPAPAVSRTAIATRGLVRTANSRTDRRRCRPFVSVGLSMVLVPLRDVNPEADVAPGHRGHGARGRCRGRGGGRPGTP